MNTTITLTEDARRWFLARGILFRARHIPMDIFLTLTREAAMAERQQGYVG